MAFNVQIFRTRALTAIVFAAIMLLGLLWNQWSFLVLFSIIHFGCWWEYFKLTEKIYNTTFHPYTKLGLMFMGFGMVLWCCGNEFRFSGYGVKENFSLAFSGVGFAALVVGIFQKNAILPKAFGMALLGLVYISLSWALLMDMYGKTAIHLQDTAYIFPGNFIPIVIIVSIWINDTMAYVVGSFIGKTPFSKISPKKTWEGTIGGIILCVLVMSLAFPRLYFSQPTTGLVLFAGSIAVVAAIVGTMGDLLESKLKRMAAVKDSGSLMPGHGGFLDRFDSLLLAIPFVWLCVQLFMR